MPLGDSMKKILLVAVCVVCFACGAWATTLAIQDKALYDENMAVATGYFADNYYPSKDAGHLAECQNEMQTAKANMQKNCLLAGSIYFAGVTTGASLVYITIKNRKGA